MPTLKTIKENPPSSYLVKLATVESGNNPNAKAKTSSASGLFQFTEGTWKELNNKYKLGYTLADRFNPEKSKKVAKLLTTENENTLKPILGRELNDGEKYLGHFLGAQGSKELLNTYLKNPNENIGNVVSSGALKANKSVFLNKDGSQKTVGEVYNWAAKKMKIEPSYANSVAPYMNQQKETVTNTINNFDFLPQTTTFASVPDSAQKENKTEEDKDVAEVEQKTKEYNFLDELNTTASFFKPRETQQIEAPQTDYMQQYEQISQFIENPQVAQSGGKYSENELAFLSEIAIKDNNGYWNKNNRGKVVEIDGNQITMSGVDQDLIGISKQTGEKKIMKPNKNYTFSNTKSVIEIPFFKK